jgi:hypothetical protein
MAENNESLTVEVPEPEAAAPVAELPTREQAMKDGLSALEADKAEKLGLIAKKDEKPAAGAAKLEPAAPEKKPEQPAAAKPAGQADASQYDLDPETQKKFEEIFGKGTNPRGLFAYSKKERAGRQAAERAAKQLADENAALKAQLTGKATPTVTPPAAGELPDENQPLTLGMLKKMQDQARAEADRQRAEQQERATAIQAAHKEQEDQAKEAYPDYDETVEKAKDVIQMFQKDEFAADPIKQAKVKDLLVRLQHSAARADQLKPDEYTAALIAYELGQQHPKYGKAADAAEPSLTTGASKDNPNAGGAGSPEKFKRIEEVTQRRGSSAALTGGGRRTVPVDDVKGEDLARMSRSQIEAFRKSNPQRYAQLMGG